MNLKEAIGFITDAATVRADQWGEAARDNYDTIDELYEADTDECANMSELLGQAIEIVSKAKPLVAEETAETAMNMMEWFCHAPKWARDHYLAEMGACAMRSNFLEHAHVLDEAWEIANKQYGYNDCFDWDFVPNFMHWGAQLDLMPDEFAANIPSFLDAMDIAPLPEIES